MGEIAELMINGDICEMCGVMLSGEGEGFPRYCSLNCAQDRGAGIEQVAGEEDLQDDD